MSDSPTLCFADTDCLFKLAAANLWDAALEVLGVTAADVRINTEPRDKLATQQKQFEKKLTVAGYRRTVGIVNSLALVETEPDPQEEAHLNNIHNIDLGEIVLICATRDVPSFCLISADRKWPRALAEQRHLHDVRNRLAGNCICFEQIILRLIESHDAPEYSIIAHRLCAIPDCMITLANVFPNGKDTPRKEAVRALRKRIEELRRVSSNFLAP
jgi:hypothetical protein